ncbi:MAG TPA: flagellar hook protein FlgE [Candidatus Hydrogenedentes bacterium]|nr:flagellar hook protein FlgE [Candidatus Hydrogenedentota bacterium]HPG67901.1 flagellar hook protein FlgE [Candidatus Hydrogenedentota bacterium]
MGGTAIYTGVTGLLAHQRRLDVVANNIANVNTTGYRGSRVQFQDLFSQTLQGATAPEGDYGGSNGKQVGLGTAVGSIDVDHSQGSLITTGVASDLAVQGNGFFVLTDGALKYYTRDGSFQLNAVGVLIDPATGMRVQGYMADATGVIDGTLAPTDIVIPIGANPIVEPTENVILIGNLSSDVAVGTTFERTVTVYDSLGTPRDIQLTFTKLATDGEWQWDAASSDSAITTVTGTGTVAFDANGGFLSASAASVSIAFDPTLPAVPTDPFQFAIDFNALSQLSGDSDVTLSSQDGFELGMLESYSIGGNGVINGVFTNGLVRELGQIALASFNNVGGLARAGDNMFMQTASSGLANLGLPNSGGRGDVSGGVLEQSNVDLGTELSNMIVTQRGFQANARTITTADNMLQETVNLVR